MAKHNYTYDSQYDWIKPSKKEEKTKTVNNLNIMNQNNMNIPNMNTISGYNINTIQNTNSFGKLNNDTNMNIFMNNATTKNSNNNLNSKSSNKNNRGLTIEPSQKLTGFNYNYNYGINNVNQQRISINHSNSKLNFVDVMPKTNKNESFPSL